MKLLIKEETPPVTITLQKYNNNTNTIIAAYRCANSDAYCILARLSEFTCGFVPLNGVGDARFKGPTWIESIELAMKSRKVYVFDHMQDMIVAMANKKF